MSLFQGAAQGALAGSSMGPVGAIGGAIIGGLSGLLGSRSARRAAQEAAQQDAQRRAAQLWGAGEYNRLGSQYGEQAEFIPQGVRTQFGRMYQTPEGEMATELDPRWAAQRDQFGSLFNQEYDRLQGFDPTKLAADRYATMQRLLAPDRAAKTESTMGMLLRKGLIGSAANDGTGAVTNPFMSSLQRSFADEDTKLGLEAMDFADRRRLQGLGLLTGFSNQMQGIDARGDNLLSQGYQWSGMMNNHNLARLNNQYNMLGRGVNLQMESMMPADFVRQASQDARDARTGMYTGFLNQMPRMFGMFTGSSPAPGYGSAPSSWGTNSDPFAGY